MPERTEDLSDLPERPHSAFAGSLADLAKVLQEESREEVKEAEIPAEEEVEVVDAVVDPLGEPPPGMDIDPDDPRYFFIRDKNGHRVRRKRGTIADPSWWTEERRREQSERVKAMIKEGTFGGHMSRRKTKPFQQLVAERAQERADDIIRTLEGMIFNQSKDKRLQLEGIRELGKFEAWAVANAREDEKEFRAMTNQQLDERLLTILGEAIGLDFTVVDAAEEDIDPDVCPDCVGEARVMERMLLDEGASEEMVVRMTARARCSLHRDLGQIGAAGRDNGS